MRLQVFLSRNGVCSRRKAMDVIKQGHVSVNGKTVREPSFDIDSQKHTIAFKGDIIQAKAYQYIMLNKPAGFVTTKADKHAKQTVYDLLPKKFHHLAPVGRLDKDSEGLLLLTNDGDFAHKLTHPSFNLDKTYFVIARGILSPKDISHLEKGMFIDGKKTSPAKVSGFKIRKGKSEFAFTIHEGMNRQIRRMLQKVGSKVMYLQRIAQGKYKLAGLKLGVWKTIKV